MRTTLTLEDDVAKLLAAEARRSGEPMKQVVNRVLRAGFSASRQPLKPFVVEPRKMELPPGLSYDNIEDLIEALEGPLHR